jgi:hypothetical protein
MSDRLNANGQITVWTGPGSDILTSQNTQYTLILQADVDHTGLTMWLGPQQHSGTPVWQTPLFPPGSHPLSNSPATGCFVGQNSDSCDQGFAPYCYPINRGSGNECDCSCHRQGF